MAELIYRVRQKLKKDGLCATFRKACRHLYARYLIKVDLISFLDVVCKRRQYDAMLDEALAGDSVRVFLWRSSFGWDVPLFQRPQHIARALSRQDTVIFYEVTTLTDKVRAFRKVNDRLILVNFNNRAARKLLLARLAACEKPKYLQFYTTDYHISLAEMQGYIAAGYRVLYEYIDELSPQLIGTKRLPKNLTDKYDYMLTDTQNVFVVVTADALWRDVAEKRGEEKLALVSNGVDFAHFSGAAGSVDADYAALCARERPIIGYYGALASWFDYELLKRCAAERQDCDFVLFGVKYDGSFDGAQLSGISNIHFLGAKSYETLPAYAARFRVCTIPFLVNEITRATNPVKLFEYMALNKPIVTTALDECRKYQSVLCADSTEAYLALLDRAIDMSPHADPDYFALLQREARQNDWSQKARDIAALLRRYE